MWGVSTVINGALNWSQTWVDFRPVRKNPWRPWFHVCALLFFIAIFCLLVFWGLVTVIWDNVPVMSNSFNHTDNYWFKFGKNQTLCDPTTLSLGSTYYTTNGLFPWRISATTMSDAWYQQTYFRYAKSSLKLYHRYSGENLSNCRPTTVSLSVDLESATTEAKMNAKCFLGDDGSYIALSTTHIVGDTASGEIGLSTPSADPLNTMQLIGLVHDEFIPHSSILSPGHVSSRDISKLRRSCVEGRLQFKYDVTGHTRTGGVEGLRSTRNGTYDWDKGLSYLIFAVGMWDLGRNDWKSGPVDNATIAKEVIPRRRPSFPPPPDATWQVQYLCNTRVVKSFWNAALSLLTSVFSLFRTVFSTFLIACAFIGDHSEYKAYFRLPDHPEPVGEEPEKDTLLDNDANNGDLSTRFRA